MTTSDPLPLTLETAHACLTDYFAPWVLALRPRITEISRDGATLEIPISPDIARVGGIVCGQALATLADTAMVFACAGRLGAFSPLATTNLDTRFLSAARGDLVRCEARVIKSGRAMMFADATLTAMPDNKPVAAASATFFRPA